MRFLLRAVVFGVALSIVALLLALWAALDSAPSITDAQAVMSARSAERAAKRLGELDPRRLRDGERRSIVLATDEVQALLQIAAKRLPDTRAQAVSVDGQMNLRTATALPGSLWLNIDAPIVIADGEPRLDGLQIGSLSLPAPIARKAFAAALPWLLRQFGYGGDPALLSEVVHGARISRDGLRIDYALSRQVAAEGMRALLPAGEAERLAAYHAELRTAVLALREGGAARDADSLPPVLQRLFALAQTRGGDTVAEQRSALLALALHVNGRSPAMLVPAAADWPPVPRQVLTLHGREDLTQHFVGSALIAAHAGAQWANAIGLSKEVRDARSGSGFSFTDLLADRAGTRLGERIAAGDDAVSRVLGGDPATEDLLPSIAGLAEFMPEAVFLRRFGGVGAPAYNAVLADIDARIAALELYK